MNTFQISSVIVTNRARYLANLAGKTPGIHFRDYENSNDGSTMLAHCDSGKIFVDLFIPHQLTEDQRRQITEGLTAISTRLSMLRMDLGHFWTLTLEAN